MQPTDATIDPGFIDHLLDGVVAAMPDDAAADATARRAMARAMLVAMRPADPVAAMLAAQAIAAHYAAMDALGRAARSEDDKTAARLRGNAASLGRMMRASLKAADARRPTHAADAAKPHARSPRSAAGVPRPPSVAPEPFADAPPVEVQAATLPLLPAWETLSMAERRAVYFEGGSGAATPLADKPRPEAPSEMPGAEAPRAVAPRAVAPRAVAPRAEAPSAATPVPTARPAIRAVALGAR